ncbi:MAG: hypothetical protein M1402_03340 [Candidatus Thermoplasmatota archaeon]|nr:hypothetical protein [Candidatus Thermoplasmatota archaeon]
MGINIKLIQRLGYILIAVSVIIFAVSIGSVYSSTSVLQKTVSSGSEISIPVGGNISRGNDILYSITPVNSSVDLTIYLLGPQGQKVAFSNISGVAYTLTKAVVTPSAGRWSLVVVNANSVPASMKITTTFVSYLTLSFILLGFALLPSGIALVILGMIIRKKQSRFSRYRFN